MLTLALTVTVGTTGPALLTPLVGAADARPAATPAASPAAHAARLKAPPKVPTSIGRGGAVATVDPDATRIGLRVLKDGGNAVDAAIAAAAALGVTEPYSSGVGGGGYFTYYNARTHRIGTIDGRETAPRGITRDAFIDPETKQPYNFTPEL